MIKTFVLDTNVLVHNPQSVFLFKNNEVIIPLVVIEELDNLKKYQDERGRAARQCSRLLDSLRELGRLTDGVKLEHGGSLRVETDLNGPLPEGLDLGKTDNSILRVALALKKKGRDVRFVSKDINARIKADALGVLAEDFENAKVNIDELYRGWVEKTVSKDLIDAFYRDKRLPNAEALLGEKVYPNEFVLFRSAENPNQSALGRVDDAGDILPLVYGEKDAWSVRALNVEQKFAMDLLLSEEVELVTLVGTAGTGKTLLAMAAGLQKVVEDKRYKKVLISRPVIPLGKDIGYLPGTKEEKLKHWMQPIFDNLEYLTHNSDEDEDDSSQVDYLLETNKLEMEAVTYIRGRSLPRQFVVVDEAQNLTPHEIKTIVSRAGEGTKVVITGDPYQIDNPYLDAESNGLTYLVEKFKGQKGFGHVTLTRSERSRLAALAAGLL
ncbi:MAG: PhoH family protein [candidate division FCPU426 bacterium]